VVRTGAELTAGRLFVVAGFEAGGARPRRAEALAEGRLFEEVFFLLPNLGMLSQYRYSTSFNEMSGIA